MRGLMSMIFRGLPSQYRRFPKRWARAAADQRSPVEVGNVDFAQRPFVLRINPDQDALAQGARSRTHEALGQHMQQEPKKQLLAAKRHYLAPVAVGVIGIAEGRSLSR